MGKRDVPLKTGSTQRILHRRQRRSELRPQITYVHKISWSLDVWFLRYASGQTDTRTYRHVHCNTSLPARGRSNYPSVMRLATDRQKVKTGNDDGENINGNVVGMKPLITRDKKSLSTTIAYTRVIGGWRTLENRNVGPLWSTVQCADPQNSLKSRSLWFVCRITWCRKHAYVIA